MGIDQLPESVRQSGVLTGNSLAKLAGIGSLPSSKSVDLWEKEPEINKILERPDAFNKLHILAQEMILNHRLEPAFKTLMVADRISAPKP